MGVKVEVEVELEVEVEGGEEGGSASCKRTCACTCTCEPPAPVYLFVHKTQNNGIGIRQVHLDVAILRETRYFE